MGDVARGRPKQSWMESIKKDMLMLRVSREMTLNKSEWKKKIHVADSKVWDKETLLLYTCNAKILNCMSF